ncbi:MAG: 2OG-Fe(II) oxygenase [Acidimicrobiia bacterium]
MTTTETPRTASIRLDRYDSARIARLAAEFQAAKPFPHLVLDDILDADPSLADAFPAPDWGGWLPYTNAYQPEKLCCSDVTVIPEPLAAVLRQCNDRPFLQFLESVTGIERLIPDPYYEGGGLHSSGPGGVLTAHTDFHIYERLRLFRRVNMIIYMNPEWSAEYGGGLELFQPGTDTVVDEVLPSFGTTVIFKTDDRSVHGFSKPIAPGHRRNSLALYYYTSEDAEVFSGDHTTHWRRHAAATGVDRVRLATYHGLLKVSRGFSMAAHLANPTQGRVWFRNAMETRRREKSGG